ncbi:hypothetical protein DFH94DRAFT_700166 [Russula ochroleuca]|uniref:F-box domain-containing protein n=1 Tax=Russula ochroleuca TaxID=152965 RepID=A0A9P5JTR5_9AGAM|nr:hypothetical protein DFH94DRAFT_700166 [Russula ochroleuca]
MGNSPHIALIHILDDDSLLNIFYIYRPAIFDGDKDYDARIGGGAEWDRERWWYKLAQVCRRWRILILESPSYLSLCLVCTYGTPVADMLAHSPPLPLVIDFFRGYRDVTAEDEEGIILALEQRHRVRHVRLQMPILKMQKLIMAVDEEYPMLEYLVMEPPNDDKSSALMLPETLQAPHLRHLMLVDFVLPIRSRLLTTAVSLVTLALYMESPSVYFQPNALLYWLSFMPQLETLVISFVFHVPNRDVERQPMQTPILTHVTPPNLRCFEFHGVSTYLEAVLCRITTPRLETLCIRFFNQITVSIPSLVQFVNTTENIGFDGVIFQFYREKVYAGMFSRAEPQVFPLHIKIPCWHLDWQVSSVAQIFNSLNQISSTVEHLTFRHEVHSLSSEEHNEVDRSEWRKLLRSFSNVKTLQVDDGLVNELSHSLRLDDGDLPLDLLPELQEITYSGSGDLDQNAGRPVTLVRPNSRSLTPLSRSSSPRLLESPHAIPAGSSKAGNDLDS